MQKPKFIWRPSSNFSFRNQSINSIILHGTGMKNDAEVLERLCSTQHEVSAHYFISLHGVIYQLVKDEDVAWHAGVSAWKNMQSLNFNSIGIELFNSTAGNGVAYHPLQYKALYKLMSYLIYTYKIPIENVLAHSDIAPDRRTDPGYLFSWNGLYLRGLGKPLPFKPNPTDKELFEMGYRGGFKANRDAYFLKFGQKIT